MKKIVFASNNKHKISEINAMLPQGYEIVTLNEVGFSGEIPETGTTIVENSKMKAAYIFDFLKSKHLNYDVIADDSGLEVQALNGAPGVDSAMYAGTHGDHEANNKKLLNELKNKTSRKARFVTVITYKNLSQVKLFEGEVKGTIAFEARGTQGFGYDPLFIPTGYRSTFAELGAEIKNKISHRAAAVEKMLNYFTSQK